MLILRVKSGNEVMARHRSGEACFLRATRHRRRYGSSTPDVNISLIQEGSAFVLAESDPGDDLISYVLVHARTKERVFMRVAYPDPYGRDNGGINVAFDDPSRNFSFDRPDVWKKNVLRMVQETVV